MREDLRAPNAEEGEEPFRPSGLFERNPQTYQGEGTQNKQDIRPEAAPGPATAFPNLILLQNKPPMVPLWLPNAASESLEKKKFVSICFGHLGPEHLVPPQLFPI